MEESSPLILPSNASGNDSSSKYYFLNKGGAGYQGGTTNAVRDADGGNVVEGMPEGAREEEFAPRELGPRRFSQRAKTSGGGNGQQQRGAQADGGGGFWSRLFGKKKNKKYGEVGTLMKLRKAPVKIEPKVFFANERTFLAWMHLSVILAGASIAILAFAQDQNPYSQLYGVLMLPVAIAFIVYSMYQYARRANMIRHRHPGPYEDTTGPAVLGIMLMVSILAQFALKLYSMSF